MSEKIKVLHLINWFVRGGIETYLLNVLANYDRSRMQFDVCCKGVDTGPLAHRADELNVPVFHIPMKATQIGFINKFQKFLVENKYEVLHSHVGELSGAAVYAAQKAGLKVRISAYHNTFPNTALSLAKVPVLSHIRKYYLHLCHNAVLKYSTHISACSKAALDAYFGQRYKTDELFCVNYYGVDTSCFELPLDIKEFKKNNGLSPDKIVVGHVGSFRWEKNHKGFLEIAKIAASQRDDLQFVFVGDGGLRPEIEALAKSDYSELDVVFLGNRDDVPEVMKAMDIMLFPSLREGFGMVVIEAAAANTPVVTSKELGLAEAMAEKNIEYTFARDDYDRAAGLILKLLNDDQAKAEYIKNSKGDLEQRFTMEAACKSLYELYISGLGLES